VLNCIIARDAINDFVVGVTIFSIHFWYVCRVLCEYEYRVIIRFRYFQASLNPAKLQCILSIRASGFVQGRVVDMRLQYYRAMYWSMEVVC
jgi:hypothetical protein